MPAPAAGWHAGAVFGGVEHKLGDRLSLIRLSLPPCCTCIAPMIVNEARTAVTGLSRDMQARIVVGRPACGQS